MESELILLKRTLALLNARINYLENKTVLIQYNSGDQFRECAVLKKTGSDYELYNGTRIIPTQDALLYTNFLHDMHYMSYKTSSINNNTISAVCCDINKAIGSTTGMRTNGKFIFYPSLKYVIQYAIIYYLWKFENFSNFHNINYLNFMYDVFHISDVFSSIPSNGATVIPCSGRSIYNLDSITTLRSFPTRQNNVGIPTDDELIIDTKALMDSIRYTAKRLFIGTILSSYFNKQSNCVSGMYDQTNGGDIDTTKQIIYNSSTGHDKYNLCVKPESEPAQEIDIDHKFLQVYYEPYEILFQNKDQYGTTVHCWTKDGKNYNYDFGLFTKNNSVLSFKNEMIDGSDSLISFDFGNNTTITSRNNIDKCIYLNNTKCGNCTRGATHILFDYHDEMDILKIHYKSTKTSRNDNEITQLIKSLKYEGFLNIISKANITIKQK